MRTLWTAAALAMTVTLASADSALVTFPDNFRNGVLYATVERENISEEIYATPEAIDAVKAGKPIPSGTVITMVDRRDGALFRYVVMEKRAGWGSEYAPEERNGEWEFQAFNPDKSVNRNENLDRCFSCHKSRAAQDFVWTFDRMKNSK
jgi:hypothetical protein